MPWLSRSARVTALVYGYADGRHGQVPEDRSSAAAWARYEITDGLTDGAEVVVKGQNGLNNGMSVERVNEINDEYLQVSGQ